MAKTSIHIQKDFNKPWGGYLKFIENAPCTVKIIVVKKDAALSLQTHKLRAEFWYVISGKVVATIGKDKKHLKKSVLNPGDTIKSPVGFLHRIEGIQASKVLEISLGTFRENDIVRHEDKYGRAPK
ncbi:MAG: mannose-1-phosphate guanylyltransferase/mannose-6-phosphate isomerase [Parcubacteria group bacterium Greene0714_21]|nr:MAG: mannose-1-phosphate guanylyltransferase/mannose-6-phosphate isomerase [Parcubacteria group bacterium Greene0416_39]TSC97474.1 MAG: mannose-1-phosphate guanylyltransferase/mannose-6-phosphate isomerase [Parcubacteria group bacterium Greene1014_47]TSD04429.1 MAG: mannose-1-phosphate guanylyltransferase/mannose-6-phosphate isomerase [Parcubacteria group bacterium Greene0714_21]